MLGFYSRFQSARAEDKRVTRESRFQTVGVWASILGVLLSVAIFIYSEWRLGFSVDLNIVWAVHSGLLICILAFWLFVVQMRLKQNLIDLHSIKNFSRFIYKVNNKIIRGKNKFRFMEKEKRKNAIYKNAQSIFKRSTEWLQTELLSYYDSTNRHLDGDLSVAIRIVCRRELIDDLGDSHIIQRFDTRGEGSSLVLVTCWRDEHTFNNLKRSKMTVYDLALNSQYMALIGPDDPASKEIFFNNNIRSAGDSFTCQNMEWRDHYNATLVCPIKFPSKYIGEHGVAYSNIVGFVTVDSCNKSGHNLFDDCLVHHIVPFVADELLDMIIAYQKLDGLDAPLDFSGQLINSIWHVRSSIAA